MFLGSYFIKERKLMTATKTYRILHQKNGILIELYRILDDLAFILIEITISLTQKSYFCTFISYVRIQINNA
jgi:hypothetical protein